MVMWLCWSYCSVLQKNVYVLVVSEMQGGGKASTAANVMDWNVSTAYKTLKGNIWKTVLLPVGILMG